jgi:hypothetical protein
MRLQETGGQIHLERGHLEKRERRACIAYCCHVCQILYIIPQTNVPVSILAQACSSIVSYSFILYLPRVAALQALWTPRMTQPSESCGGCCSTTSPLPRCWAQRSWCGGLCALALVLVHVVGLGGALQEPSSRDLFSHGVHLRTHGAVAPMHWPQDEELLGLMLATVEYITYITYWFDTVWPTLFLLFLGITNAVWTENFPLWYYFGQANPSPHSPYAWWWRSCDICDICGLPTLIPPCPICGLRRCSRCLRQGYLCNCPVDATRRMTLAAGDHTPTATCEEDSRVPHDLLRCACPCGNCLYDAEYGRPQCLFCQCSSDRQVPCCCPCAGCDPDTEEDKDDKDQVMYTQRQHSASLHADQAPTATHTACMPRSHIMCGRCAVREPTVAECAQCQKRVCAFCIMPASCATPRICRDCYEEDDVSGMSSGHEAPRRDDAGPPWKMARR